MYEAEKLVATRTDQRNKYVSKCEKAEEQIAELERHLEMSEDTTEHLRLKLQATYKDVGNMEATLKQYKAALEEVMYEFKTVDFKQVAEVGIGQTHMYRVVDSALPPDDNQKGISRRR